MKYFVYSDLKYTGMSYDSVDSSILDFEYSKGNVIIASETEPSIEWKGVKIVSSDSITQAKADECVKSYNIEVLKEELRSFEFFDAQAKCLSDGLIFADKYPELQAKRLAIVAQIDALEA